MFDADLTKLFFQLMLLRKEEKISEKERLLLAAKRKGKQLSLGETQSSYALALWALDLVNRPIQTGQEGEKDRGEMLTNFGLLA